MTQFIITSLVLTVALNLLIRVPAVQRMISGMLQPRSQENSEGVTPGNSSKSSVKVYFPWKAMLIGSILLTVLINVLGLFR